MRKVTLRGPIDADYIHLSLDPNRRREKVARAVAILRHKQFDAIAIRGNSGAIIGGAIATALNKPIILVRKDKWKEESHHSMMHVEGPLNWSPLARYVIVDDFVSSGATFRKIQDAIAGRAECVGAYLYRDEEFTAIADFEPRWKVEYDKPAAAPVTTEPPKVEIPAADVPYLAPKRIFVSDDDDARKRALVNFMLGDWLLKPLNPKPIVDRLTSL
jgi:hypoxanthine phosphoribosyltransferase